MLAKGELDDYKNEIKQRLLEVTFSLLMMKVRKESKCILKQL